MNTSDEYRRNARECQRMADNARNPADKASWLRLAASWLGMLKNASGPGSQQPFANKSTQRAGEPPREETNWPAPSDEDSQASH